MKKSLLYGFLIILCSCVRTPVDPELPNIIFLLTDDQRWDLLGANGNDVIQTPNLDRLAEEGTNFKQHYVTTSICSVSRASILSGQYGRRHGLWGFGSSFSEEAFRNTYPMLLKQSGYWSGFIGKYGVGSTELPSREFNYWNGFANQGKYNQVDSEGKPIHLTEKIGNQIIDFLERSPQDQPFCLSVSFKAPHVQDGANIFNLFPHDIAYSDAYEEVDWIRPELTKPLFHNHFPVEVFGPDNVARVRYRQRFLDQTRYERSLKGYYRLVHGVDVQVGRMLEFLEENNLSDNTIIIFSSDNGFYLGEYGFAGKWYGSQPSIRAPLIIYDPRNKTGQEIEALSLNIDIAATILDYAGVAKPSDYQGESLLPMINGSRSKFRDEFFYEHLWPITPGFPIPSTEGVVTKDQKYMTYFNGMDNTDILFEEWYDLERDPMEVRNLMEQEIDTSPLIELRQKIKEYKEKLK